MGMHVSCVIMKDAERANLSEILYKKRTYLTFIGKAKQDQGAVMAIYQSVLKQLKKVFLTWNPLLTNLTMLDATTMRFCLLGKSTGLNQI